MNINLPSLSSIIAALSGIGGVVGVVFTALGVGDLTKPVTILIGSISGLLTAIAAHHSTSIVAAKAKANIPIPPVPVGPLLPQ